MGQRNAPDSNKNMKPLRLNKFFVAYLIFTVFLVGAIVMLIEILAARIIAPFFGSSVFVWTSVISVTLLSLALGYFLGGKVADRAYTPNLLYNILVLSGAYLFLVLCIKKITLTFSAQLGLRLGALVSSSALFALPLLLLGMVTPLSVKLYTKRIENLGSGVGLLYFFSTLGSFLGTLLSGFILIPQFGVSKILIFSANLLVITAVIYFIALSRNIKYLLLTAVLPLNLIFLGSEKLSTVFIEGICWQELHRADSFYGRLKIIEVNNVGRYFIVDGINQGGLNILNGLSQEAYSYVIEALSNMACPQIKRALVIGLGPGIIPNAFSKKGIFTDVAEIDPQIVSLYKRFFGRYGRAENIAIFVEDGRHFIKRRAGRFDIAVLDVFLGDNSPWHLLTLEAFSEIKDVLSDKGALVINFIGLPHEASGAKIICAIHQTLSQVFPYVYMFNSSRPLREDVRNIFFTASLQEPGHNFPEDILIPSGLEAEVRETIKDRKACRDGGALLLTDEYNPVDFYTARSKEALRKVIMKTTGSDFMLN
jgi:spermidine synthase